MNKTSVGSILGGAFGLVRSKPAAVAVWALVYIAATAGMALVMRPMMSQMPPASADPQASLAAFRQMFGTLGSLWLLMMLVYTILYAASQRAVLRPGDSGFAYLRIGMDELRLIGVTLLLALGLFVVMIALIIALSLITFTIVFAAGPGAAMPLIVLLYIVLLGFIAWLEVRFSLVFSLTLLRGEITITESWRLTRGHFWTLFGAYLVLILILIVLSIAVSLVTAGPYIAEIMRSGFSQEAMQAAAQRQLEEQMAGISVTTIIGWIVSGLVGGLSIALIGGAVATATRDLTQDSDGMANTFA